MSARRGFTLVEALVASAVLMAAIAAASTVMITASSLTRNAENASEDFDHARLAGDQLAREIQSAGLLTPGGLYISTPGSLNFPLYGIDGVAPYPGSTGGAPRNAPSDDLWLIVPDRNAMREPCVDPGAGLPVTVAAASGPLTVQCPPAGAITTFNATDFLVAANLSARTGALLSPGLVFGTNTIQYAEQAVANFSDAPPPSGTGFQVGDMVFRATPWHYFTLPIPASGNTPAWVGLFRHRGLAQTDPSTGSPLRDDPAYKDQLVQVGVEDLQIAFGMDDNPLHPNSGDPQQYQFQAGLPPAFNGSLGLRTVRLSIVARSRQTVQDVGGLGKTVTQKGLGAGSGITVENHTIAPDGYQRAVYTRRLELPNLTPVAL
jgi:type II secretory pathway pseudopilin PulG